jgi:hypothetical protein
MSAFEEIADMTGEYATWSYLPHDLGKFSAANVTSWCVHALEAGLIRHFEILTPRTAAEVRKPERKDRTGEVFRLPAVCRNDDVNLFGFDSHQNF